MKTVYFVRHGESEGNVANVYQSADTALTEKGMKQARVAAERCDKISVDVVIASTMKRALQTAQIICENTAHNLESSDLFIERYRPDEIAGKRKNDPEIQQLGTAWIESIFRDGPRVSNGENFDDLKIRAGQALEYLERHSSERILVVTHGFFLRLLVARVIFGPTLTPADLEMIMNAFRTTNTGITMLQFGKIPEGDTDCDEERWIVRVWNDHAHLG